jgi:hypothetical protein
MPNADSTDEIFMTTAVTLRRAQTEIDDWIWEKWEGTIQAGALGTLLAIPNASWFNGQLAMMFDENYKRGIRRARAIALKGTGEQSGQVIPRDFIVQGDTASIARSTSWE